MKYVQYMRKSHYTNVNSTIQWVKYAFKVYVRLIHLIYIVWIRITTCQHDSDICLTIIEKKWTPDVSADTSGVYFYRTNIANSTLVDVNGSIDPALIHYFVQPSFSRSVWCSTPSVPIMMLRLHFSMPSKSFFSVSLYSNRFLIIKFSPSIFSSVSIVHMNDVK